MWNRGGIRSSALEKAKAQLSGLRVPNRDDERRDAVRTSTGKSLQSRQMSIHSLSDLSSDAESEKQDYQAHPAKTEPGEHLVMCGGSRFLKKFAKRQSSPADTSEVMIIPQHSSQSTALSRLALIENRIRNRTNQNFGVGQGAGLQSGLSVQSSSDLSAGDGSHFLKKKASSPTPLKESERSQTDICMAPARSVSCMQKSVSMDSDEEDMRRLLGESFESPVWPKGTRESETNPQADKAYRRSSEEVAEATPSREEKQPVQSAFTAQHRKSRSPSPPSSRKDSSSSRLFSCRSDLVSSLHSGPDHSEIRSLEELFPLSSNHADTQSETSVLSDDFKINVMTLDDLAPDPHDTAELSKEKVQSAASPRHLVPSSAGKFLHKPENEPVYESDFESEFQTGTAHSADDVSEHLSDGREHSSVASESQPESVKSDDDDDTLSEKSPKIRRSRSESSLSNRGSDAPSNTARVKTGPQSPSVRGRKKDATVQTQAGGLAYMWSSDQALLGPSIGMSYVDPTPVASHMISAEAMEALTAYSPAVLVLNDMQRQQLALTKSFIQSSRHLHRAMLESLGPADYRYTTLEDTKEFIRCNRPPKLTMEDALEEVLQEMRDYHYI